MRSKQFRPLPRQVSFRSPVKGFWPLYISRAAQGDVQSSTFSRIKSFHLRSWTPRSAKVVEVEYLRNPLSAILIALINSSLDISATCPNTSAEEGSYTGKVFPFFASTHSPPMNPF